MSRTAAVDATIQVGRGRTVRVVGQAGADRLNVDIHAAGDVTCSELTQGEARQLRDALDAFLCEQGCPPGHTSIHWDTDRAKWLCDACGRPR